MTEGDRFGGVLCRSGSDLRELGVHALTWCQVVAAEREEWRQVGSRGAWPGEFAALRAVAEDLTRGVT